MVRSFNSKILRELGPGINEVKHPIAYEWLWLNTTDLACTTGFSGFQTIKIN